MSIKTHSLYRGTYISGFCEIKYRRFISQIDSLFDVWLCDTFMELWKDVESSVPWETFAKAPSRCQCERTAGTPVSTEVGVALKQNDGLWNCVCPPTVRSKPVTFKAIRKKSWKFGLTKTFCWWKQNCQNIIRISLKCKNRRFFKQYSQIQIIT